LLAVAVFTSWPSSFFGFVQNLWGKGRQQPNAVDDPGKLESYSENLQDRNVQCAMCDPSKKKKKTGSVGGLFSGPLNFLSGDIQLREYFRRRPTSPLFPVFHLVHGSK
jgi:hypothetical protein